MSTVEYSETLLGSPGGSSGYMPHSPVPSSSQHSRVPSTSQEDWQQAAGRRPPATTAAAAAATASAAHQGRGDYDWYSCQIRLQIHQATYLFVQDWLSHAVSCIATVAEGFLHRETSPLRLWLWFVVVDFFFKNTLIWWKFFLPHQK